ncbi:hypothetical protein [Rhodopirellula bahusiensis]|uniref:hypothetical protein n=1 Tax=Rhodopirellula bahusiensis TaxID=2014065 RepID=UPI0032664673
MSRNKSFQISIPTDKDGFVGRACDAHGCKQYFKIFVPDHRETLYCPYCGAQFHKNQLITANQLKHVREAGLEEVREYALDEIQKMFKSAFRGSKNIKYTPGRRRPKRTVRPHYVERKVDTEFECAECTVKFQVYGIFGYCPGCKCENLQIYDANWANIKRKLSTEESELQRTLRHAYGDLVSTFEVFCAQRGKRLTDEKGNFQVLFDARKFFKKHGGVDIVDEIETSDLLALRRLFQKRHVFIHAGGEITERYVKMIPEDKPLLGTTAALSVAELETASGAMRHALGKLIKSMERKG